MSSFATTTVDFCISDPLTVDAEVFGFWLEGFSVEEAAAQVLAQEVADSFAADPDGPPMDM